MFGRGMSRCTIGKLIYRLYLVVLRLTLRFFWRHDKHAVLGLGRVSVDVELCIRSSEAPRGAGNAGKISLLTISVTYT